MNIKITKMSLDGHQITVPPGLSELINRGGAWSNKDAPKLNNYKREVKKINGGLVTELIFIGG